MNSYPEKFQKWLDEQEKCGRVLKVTVSRTPYTNFYHGYVSPGHPTLVICECLTDAQGNIKKFAEVYSDIVTLEKVAGLV